MSLLEVVHDHLYSPSHTITHDCFDIDFVIKCTSGTTDIRLDNQVAAKIQAGSFGTGTGTTLSGNDTNDLGAPPARPCCL